MTTITKRERYQGAMVGVLCGDALGAPYETWSAADILADMDRRGGLVPFDYPNPWKKEGPPAIFPMGRPTDDSDHTAALAESLIAKRGLDEVDLFNRLRRVVFDHVSPLWDGKAFGAGKTTRKMLRPATWVESVALPKEDDYPSNGSLMRSAPMALFFGGFDAVDPKVVDRMSEVTHRHELARDCCLAYIGALAHLLEDKDPEFAVKSNIGFSLSDHVMMHAEKTPRDPEEWPGRGAASVTLHIGVWSLLTTKSFREGLTKAIMIGGDTDTYAAVAGGLLGAYYGIEGIPEEWKRMLIGRSKMLKLADQLYDLAHP